MRLKRIALTMLVPLLLGGAAAPPAALPGWMAGAWIESGDSRWTEEYWTAPRGGIMIGAGRSGAGEALASWEAMRIERRADGGLTYWGAPKWEGAVAFPEVERAEGRIVFANPGHDYPQKISYWREGGLLIAEIAMMDGSNAMRWRYRAQ